MRDRQRQIQPFQTNGHLPGLSPPVGTLRRWCCAWRSTALIWVVALMVSWLIGLGVIRLVVLVEGLLH